MLERDHRVGGERRRGHALVVAEAVAEERERPEARAPGRERELEQVVLRLERADPRDLAARAHDRAARGAGRLDGGLDDHA